MAVPNFQCNYCDVSAPSSQLLQKHVRQTHIDDPNFQIQCSNEGCRRTFTHYRTFQNHLLSHTTTSLHTLASSAAPSVNDESDHYQADNDGNLTISTGNVTELDPCRFTLKDHIAKWILKTGESRYLTRTAMMGILEDVSDIVQLIISHLHSEVCAFMCSTDTAPDNLHLINEIFQKESYTLPFNGLDSYYLQLQYFKKHFAFVVSSN